MGTKLDLLELIADSVIEAFEDLLDDDAINSFLVGGIVSRSNKLGGSIIETLFFRFTSTVAIILKVAQVNTVILSNYK